jgi:hypothetical protein
MLYEQDAPSQRTLSVTKAPTVARLLQEKYWEYEYDEK